MSKTKKQTLEELLEEKQGDIDYLCAQLSEARRAQKSWQAAYTELADAYRKDCGKVWPVCKITEKKLNRYSGEYTGRNT